MTRVVYVGGFGNGRACAEGVAEALSSYYEEVDPFTFSDAMNDPNKIHKAVDDVDVVTHSAGILAIQDAYPESVIAFNPPIDTYKTRLISRTLVKMAHMHMPGRGIRNRSDIAAVAHFDASAVAELVAHPKANFGNLGKIANFNAVDMAIGLVSSYAPVGLIYTDNDDYFQLSESNLHLARLSNVGVKILPGEHDELVLRPDQTLAKHYATSF